MKKQRQFLIQAAYLAVWGLLIWSALRWLVPFLLPFLAALGLAWVLHTPARALARSAGIRRRAAAGLLLCLVAVVVLGGFGYLAARLLVLAGLALGRLPAFFTESCLPLLEQTVQELFPYVGADAAAVNDAIFTALTDALAAASAGLAAAAGRALAALPSLVIPLVFACIAAVYCALDYDKLVALAAGALGPQRWERALRVKNRGLAVLGRLLRAYFLLFCLTAVQLAAGFVLLGVSDAVWLALLVALVDSLPVLGVGTVLLPWAGIAALTGQSGLALGLLVLYLVIWVVRQLCEPRLVGAQLGLHPLASLLCIYAGLRLYGILGAMALPAALTVLWQTKKESRPRE